MHVVLQKVGIRSVMTLVLVDILALVLGCKASSTVLWGDLPGAIEESPG